jgi:uncharacterized protein YdbL (DUF1318 family)
MPTERLIDVKRIPLPAFGVLDDTAAKAEIDAALAAGQIVEPTDGALVIRQRVELRGRGRTE